MKKKIIGFALTLIALLVALSVPAQAQKADKIHRIGFLSGGFPGPSHWTAILRTELQQLGYVEGKNIAIESRFSENKLDRLPSLADELVRLKVDVIVAGGRNDTRAARKATTTIPIVGQSLLDPVADGLLESLARPGGNVTGFTPLADVLVGKRLELLKETIANLSRVALLWNPQDQGSARQWRESQIAARELGATAISGGEQRRKVRCCIQRSKSDARRSSRDDIERVCQCSSKTDHGPGGKKQASSDIS